MTHRILGLHHVTATVDGAQDDLDFSVGALGLRLVKKTVNFDNHYVFHFYYGDERGTPGTLWTTFPYRGWRVQEGERGAGQVVATAFSVPVGSLGLWETRLAQQGIAALREQGRFGDAVLAFRDPSGLEFELIGASDRRRPWTHGVGDETAIRGLHSVTLLVRTPGPTVDLLTSLLDFVVVDEMDGRIRLAVHGAAAGRLVDVAYDDSAPTAKNGLGTVHHVALAVDSEAHQLALRAELVARGLRVTEVRDRQYFKSIYFREPGGVLLEVATVDPGFTVDEDAGRLGRDLKLPPWEEPHRVEIERRLPPISVP